MSLLSSRWRYLVCFCWCPCPPLVSPSRALTMRVTPGTPNSRVFSAVSAAWSRTGETCTTWRRAARTAASRAQNRSTTDLRSAQTSTSKPHGSLASGNNSFKFISQSLHPVSTIFPMKTDKWIKEERFKSHEQQKCSLYFRYRWILLTSEDMAFENNYYLVSTNHSLFCGIMSHKFVFAYKMDLLSHEKENTIALRYSCQPLCH